MKRKVKKKGKKNHFF